MTRSLFDVARPPHDASGSWRVSAVSRMWTFFLGWRAGRRQKRLESRLAQQEQALSQSRPSLIDSTVAHSYKQRALLVVSPVFGALSPEVYGWAPALVVLLLVHACVRVATGASRLSVRGSGDCVAPLRTRNHRQPKMSPT